MSATNYNSTKKKHKGSRTKPYSRGSSNTEAGCSHDAAAEDDPVVETIQQAMRSIGSSLVASFTQQGIDRKKVINYFTWLNEKSKTTSPRKIYTLILDALRFPERLHHHRGSPSEEDWKRLFMQDPPQEEEGRDSPMDVDVNENLLPEESVDLSTVSTQEEAVTIEAKDTQKGAELECQEQVVQQGFPTTQTEAQYGSQDFNSTRVLVLDILDEEFQEERFNMWLMSKSRG